MRRFSVFSRRTAQATGGLVLAAFLFAGPGCSSDDDDTAAPPAGGTCINPGGPVPGEADNHCTDSSGEPIVQEIGACMADAGETGGGGAGGEAAEEPYEVRFSNSAHDDDCKYDVSFENSCIELNTKVTFTVTLTKRTGGVATGATPDSPEIFLEADPSHISPSNAIKAPESPPGTYEIGPIVFDRSGRWVVRFHFFESCSDIPEDSPHGHIAFYIDVP